MLSPPLASEALTYEKFAVAGALPAMLLMAVAGLLCADNYFVFSIDSFFMRLTFFSSFKWRNSFFKLMRSSISTLNCSICYAMTFFLYGLTRPRSSGAT